MAKIDKANVVVGEQVNSAEDKLELAIKLQQQWRFEEARAKYEAILQEDPEDANAHHNLGVLFSVQLLQPLEALPHFEAALNINPTRLQFWFSYIDALIKVGAVDVAEHVLVLASNYGLNDLQISSFERDIRLTRMTVKDLVDDILRNAEPLPNPEEEKAPVLAGKDPNTGDLQQLLSLFNQKKYENVVKSSKGLLQRFPASVSVWKLLAEALKRTGSQGEALKAYVKLMALQPHDVSIKMEAVNAFMAVGDQDGAMKVLEEILRVRPDYAPAHGKMGQIYQKCGDTSAALFSYARALRDEPYDPIVLEKFGAILRAKGDQDGALVCFKSAVESSPESAELQDAYGITLRNQERLAAAENAFRTALKINPGYTPALRNLCHLLELHGRFAEAESGLLRCTEIDNESPDSLFEVGRNLFQQKRNNEALDWLRRVIKAKPDHVGAHITLSGALGDSEDPLSAMEEVKASIRALPNIPHLHTNLGIINLSLSRADDAIACFRKALEINPKFSHARSSMLFALSHSTKITPEELYREHRIYGRLIEEEVKGKEYTTYTNKKTLDRPLKIGFVSADFRNHAVAKFVIPFFEEFHKKSEFITYAYSNHGAVDESMLSIKKNMDVWRTVVKWTDDKLIEKIREDEIDILVDMSGHTAGDRLKVFAHHPAPLQITWVGYPGTTGLKAMDYILASNSIFLCDGINRQFTENIIGLPISSTFDGKNSINSVQYLPCEKNNFFTFGSFNRLNKINRGVINIWAQVLKQVPNSRLQMAGMPSNHPPQELIKWFAEEGISEERIYFYPRSGFKEYLNLYNQVDCCLDTFPYTGGTTTFHGLWMGVPTLTMIGKNYSSYQGKMIMRQFGLDDYFVAHNNQDFLEKAEFIANNKDFLRKIRCELRDYLFSSYDESVKGCVAGFSYAMRLVWENWCKNKPKKDISILEEDIGINIKTPNWLNF